MAARAINCTDDRHRRRHVPVHRRPGGAHVWHRRAESHQKCKDGWPTGLEAKRYLQKLMERRQIVCHDKGRDQYGRWIARCYAGEILGKEMVLAGHAWAFTKYLSTCVAEE